MVNQQDGTESHYVIPPTNLLEYLGIKDSFYDNIYSLILMTVIFWFFGLLFLHLRLNDLKKRHKTIKITEN